MILAETNKGTALISDEEEVEIRTRISLPTLPHLEITHCLASTITTNITTTIQKMTMNYIKEMFNIASIVEREHKQKLEVTEHGIILPETMKIERSTHCAIQGAGNSSAVDLTDQCESLELNNHRQLYMSTLCTRAEVKTLNIEVFFDNRISKLILHKTRNRREAALSLFLTFPEAPSVEPVVINTKKQKHKTTTSYTIDVIDAARIIQEKVDIYFTSNAPMIKRNDMTISIQMEKDSGDTKINSACSSLGLLSLTALSTEGDIITDEQTSRTSRGSRRKGYEAPHIFTDSEFDRDESEQATTARTITRTQFGLEEQLELESRGKGYVYEDYMDEFSAALKDLSEALDYRKRRKRDIMNLVSFGTNMLTYTANRRAISAVKRENLEIANLQKLYSQELERKISSVTIEETRQRKDLQERIKELCELDQRIEISTIKNSVQEELNFMTLKLLRQESNGGKYSAAHTAAMDLCVKMGSFPKGCESYFETQGALYRGISPIFTSSGNLALEQIFVAKIPKISYIGTAIRALSIPIPLEKKGTDLEDNPPLYTYLSIEAPAMIIKNENEIFDISNCDKKAELIFCTSSDLTRSNAQNYCAQSLLQKQKRPSCPSQIIQTASVCLGKLDENGNLLVSGFAKPIRVNSGKQIPMGTRVAETSSNGTIEFFEANEKESVVTCGSSWWNIPALKVKTKILNLELKTGRTNRLESESSYVLKNSHLNTDFRQSKYYNDSSIKDAKEKLETKLSFSRKLKDEISQLSFKTKAITVTILAVVILITLCIAYLKLKLWLNRIKSSLPCFTTNRPVPKKRKKQREQPNSRESSVLGI